MTSQYNLVMKNSVFLQTNFSEAKKLARRQPMMVALKEHVEQLWPKWVSCLHDASKNEVGHKMDQHLELLPGREVVLVSKLLCKERKSSKCINAGYSGVDFSQPKRREESGHFKCFKRCLHIRGYLFKIVCYSRLDTYFCML